jgi:hypothetical protein
VGALLGGLVGRLVGGLGRLMGRDRDAPAHTDLRLRGRTTALGSALASGLASALAAGLVFGLPGGLVFGLVFGLGFGMVGGLISFVASPSIARRASSPAESQRGDRRLTVLATSTPELVGMLVFGVVGGLVFGLAFGLATSSTCWPAFVLASLWLGVRRRSPFRLMGFLDDAYRLGLLRIVGPVYQFRHAALQDHLAPPGESKATALLPPRTT